VPPQQPDRAPGLPRRALLCTYGCKELQHSLLARSSFTSLCLMLELGLFTAARRAVFWRQAADGGKCSSAGAGRLRAAGGRPELTARGIMDGYDVFDH